MSAVEREREREGEREGFEFCERSGCCQEKIREKREKKRSVSVGHEVHKRKESKTK